MIRMTCDKTNKHSAKVQATEPVCVDAFVVGGTLHMMVYADVDPDEDADPCAVFDGTLPENHSVQVGIVYPEVFVIQHDDKPLFWSNEHGWGSLDGADVFTYDEHITLNLPADPCGWVKLPDFYHI